VGILFLISLIIFKPQAKVYPRAASLNQSVQLLPSSSALAEGESLLDSSVIYLPSSSKERRVASTTETIPVEDAPLPTFGPQFRFSPTRPLDLSLEAERPQAPSPHQAYFAQGRSTLGLDGFCQFVSEFDGASARIV
jgi:hypothetical protein